MKPLKLTIEGINSFTDRQEIDFAQLSEGGIFCICGPTGSGKTTILDCIILALYAPREHNRGSLKDYINTGCEKGKITLEFSSDGAVYTVYRELKRNSSSAARLTVRDTGEVLADRADTVTDAVKKMLKLDKDDFTKVVVLEQGKYAEFMGMTKVRRNETVAKLFDLDRFAVLKETVSKAKIKYEGEVEKCAAALAQYEDVTEQKLAQCKREKKETEKALDEAKRQESVAAAAVQAGEHAARSAQLRAQAAQAEREAQAVLDAGAARQAGIAEKEREAAACEQAAESLRKQSEQAGALLTLAQACEEDERAAKEKEGKRDELRKAYAAYENECAAARRTTEQLFARENELRQSIQAEQAALSSARQSYEDIQRQNAALTVRLSLRDGDTCPVCGGAFHASGAAHGCEDEQRAAAYKAAWQKSEKALAAYTEEVQKNIQSRSVFAAQEATAKAKQEGIKEDGIRLSQEVTQLRQKIAERLGGQTTAAVREGAQKARAAFESAQKTWAAARDGLAQLRSAAAAQEASAKEKLAAAQNTLRSLPGDAFDLAAFEEAGRALAACKNRVEELNARLGKIVANIETVQAQLQKKKALAAQKAQAAAMLDNVLKLYACTNKDKLLTFVAEQYVREFTAAGGETLFALSNGKYRLEYVDGEFYVKDFFADDAMRKVKTLSGGETFLASMSIAMAISRSIASQNYEFFFLDEGFGTLHEQAVQTVATALKELSRTTTVGIVTHRTELAELIGTRLQVIPATESTGSKVEYV